jgi:flagellar hook-length control protein FliK
MPDDEVPAPVAETGRGAARTGTGIATAGTTSATAAAGTMTGGSAHAAPTPSPTAAAPVAAPLDLAGRVDQIDALRADAAAQPVSRMTLKVENAGGGEDRIRVDLRGQQVGAAIQTPDAEAAARLTSRVGELRDALSQHGLTAGAVTVNTTSQHPGATPDRDRGGNPAREDAWQRQQDASRNRSRREQRGDAHR